MGSFEATALSEFALAVAGLRKLNRGGVPLVQPTAVVTWLFAVFAPD